MVEFTKVSNKKVVIALEDIREFEIATDEVTIVKTKDSEHALRISYDDFRELYESVTRKTIINASADRLHLSKG